MSKYTLLTINGKWYRAQVVNGGISTTERFDGMNEAIDFIRHYRRMGWCQSDTMRYW